MKFTPTQFTDVLLIEPERLADERGWFGRIFCEREFGQHGLEGHFVQMNRSFNRTAGTFRGLHFQVPPFAEGK